MAKAGSQHGLPLSMPTIGRSKTSSIYPVSELKLYDKKCSVN